MDKGRSLIYVPILHTQRDMGSLGASAKGAFVEKLGKKLWKHRVRAVDEMWSGIDERIRQIKLPCRSTYVYQDGLPVCGKEVMIIRDLAKKGSPNHKIIQGLLNRGATVVGTEDPQLLMEEYSHVKGILLASSPAQRKKLVEQYEKKASELLKARDLFIRDRIDKTLPQDGVGLLFIGLLHRVDELLPVTIHVSYLIYRLPFKRSFEIEVLG